MVMKIGEGGEGVRVCVRERERKNEGKCERQKKRKRKKAKDKGEKGCRVLFLYVREYVFVENKNISHQLIRSIFLLFCFFCSVLCYVVCSFCKDIRDGSHYSTIFLVRLANSPTHPTNKPGTCFLTNNCYISKHFAK